MYPNIKQIHFVGIGGIGMSGIAEILLNLGYDVSGSDLKKTPVTARLRRLGAKIRYGHDPDYVEKAHVVVISSAINRSNPEVVAARARGIPVIARAEMLAELMRLKYGIAVAGTHGKTTTTSLIASILSEAKFDPTIIIGGRVRSLRSNARLGKGDFLVAEADESDGSFLHLNPTIAVVTNIDPEHLDHYKDYEELKKAFARFCERIPFYGAVIVCADHPASAKLAEGFQRRLWTYGIAKHADFMAKKIRPVGSSMHFTVYFQGKSLGEIRLALPGNHNVANAMAAIAVARDLGISFPIIRRALRKFKGIARRVEVVHQTSTQGAPIIIDDYGHHPVEIEATVAAIRNGWPNHRIRAVFQPHRFSRTKDFFEDFTRAFAKCHEVVVTDIYPAGEKPIIGVSGRRLAEAIRKPKAVKYFSDFDSVTDYLWQSRRDGDLFLTLGAGNIGNVAKDLARLARGKRSKTKDKRT